jgi:hypothetical protein
MQNYFLCFTLLTIISTQYDESSTILPTSTINNTMPPKLLTSQSSQPKRSETLLMLVLVLVLPSFNVPLIQRCRTEVITMPPVYPQRQSAHPQNVLHTMSVLHSPKHVLLILPLVQLIPFLQWEMVLQLIYYPPLLVRVH